MIKLIHLEDEISWQFYYEFVCLNNSDWKKSYELMCYYKKIVPIKQNNLSDYEFFKQTKKQESIQDLYILINKNKPITLISSCKRNEYTFDLAFSTINKYRKKGYASLALKLLEEQLFNNLNIKYTTIINMNSISSKIALNAGYIYNKDGFYIKANPNLSNKWLS